MILFFIVTHLCNIEKALFAKESVALSYQLNTEIKHSFPSNVSLLTIKNNKKNLTGLQLS